MGIGGNMATSDKPDSMFTQEVTAEDVVVEASPVPELTDAEKFDERHPVVIADLPATVGPMEIMMAAVKRGAGVDELAILKETYQWQKEIKADAAKEAYHKDFALFKANPPEILKTSRVYYEKKDKSIVDYCHADLGEICEAISKRMGEYNLYPTWDQKRVEDGIEVPCIITHALGHSETYGPIFGPLDSSGNKNPIQSASSTNTYLQRISLLGATGLAAKGMDDDGNAAGKKGRKKSEYITEAQQKALAKDLKEIYGQDASMFFEWIGVETVDTILVSDMPKIKKGLGSAKKAKAESAKSQREPGMEG
jgi:hypothetical protein